MHLGITESGPVKGRRVAITGLGVVSCCGIGAGAFWEGLLGDQQQGERLVRDFNPLDWLGPKEARRLDKFAHYAIAASQMAFDDAASSSGSLDVAPEKAGVVISTGFGGLETFLEQVRIFNEKGAKRVSPFMIPMLMANAATASVSMRLGWTGPSENVVTACAAGTHGIAAAARMVASGRLDVAIGGGSEASIAPLTVAAFGNMTALSDDGMSRPFDKRRSGFVLGEGAGALVLEDLDHAHSRGAHVYAEITGAASTADAYHVTQPAPDARGAISCMELAIADAGLTASDIGQINAHGTSTPLNDLAESLAIHQVFGSPGPPVTSTKGITGHALGAAGAIEAVAIVLSIEKSLIPPTAGYEIEDSGIALDVVYGTARPWNPGHAISNSFGFGGHNGCLVISATS
ncbi:MAG: beta-ketoacyl-ACP synthase II [Actinobacteria bacterium]|nr:beta-ketoacyl-ACP synthase II [Actinomycetota bacterium]MCL5446023.1 beta-ketoacyl-ACP synthase II [Actinomycetota bacterium]